MKLTNENKHYGSQFDTYADVMSQEAQIQEYLNNERFVRETTDAYNKKKATARTERRRKVFATARQ